jgi:voltage-gated potassium channel
MKLIPRGRFASLNEFQRQHKFVFLFGGLLLLLLVAPVLERSNASRELLAVFTTLILFSAVYSSFKESRWIAVTVFLLAALNVLTLWWEYAFWSTYVALVHYLGLVIFFFLIIVIIYRQNSRETSINHNVIYGAVTVYLLIAFTWGLLFASLHLLDPGSFRNLATTTESHFSMVPFWYLSFFTITTLGYTDIAPASDLANSLAVIEAVVGQLYLILQVSLLVGLRVSAVAARHREKPASDQEFQK